MISLTFTMHVPIILYYQNMRREEDENDFQF